MTTLESKKAAAKRLIELSRTGVENRTAEEDKELYAIHLNHADQLAEDWIEMEATLRNIAFAHDGFQGSRRLASETLEKLGAG